MNPRLRRPERRALANCATARNNIGIVHPSIFKVKKTLENQGKCLVQVLVRTDCPLTKVREVRADGSLKIDVSAPPVNGQANRALCLYLANELSVSLNSVNIIRGSSQSNKLILIKYF